MAAVADKHIIDLLKDRDGLVTLVKMKSGVTYRVHNIAWGYDMDDSYAHVTSNISPSLPETQVDFFFTREIDVMTNEVGENLSAKARYAFIDGNNFGDMLEFYDEVERKLTRDLDWNIGRNLNAFNDILRGGFGLHEYEEPLHLSWLNTVKSRKDLGDLFEHIVDIIKGHEHITLELND
jgi:RNAse (barnase) inhibitor barstar